jgi:hypothetical protein
MRVPCSNPLAIRINHVQGERLRAADLQDGLGVESWMRQLHMIGLHDTWGIALGLVATLLEDTPGRGVRVTAGLAYDARGRSLMLEAPHVAPNPWPTYPAADALATFDLVLIADAERHRRPATRDDLLCLNCRPAPMRDRPAMAWLPSASVRLGVDIVLTRAARRFPKELLKPGDPPPELVLDPSVRQLAESQARPQIAAGTTTPDQVWHPWIPAGQQDVIGFWADVDISDAGFATVPTVQASLTFDTTGPAGTGPLTQLAALDQPYFTRVEVDWTNYPGQFHFVIIPAYIGFLVSSTAPANGLAAGQSYLSPFAISWVGVEPVQGSPVGSEEYLGPTVRCCQPPATSTIRRLNSNRRLS